MGHPGHDRVLTTVFTLVVSNVGATVLLVPLAANVAVGVDADPATFALMVAIAASNAFLLPTHQVNALLMGPGRLPRRGLRPRRDRDERAVPARLRADGAVADLSGR
jgi:hypothetical protein